MTIVVVSRHPALVEYIREGYDEPIRVLAHVAPADIIGQNVVGNLPLHLAELANTVTEIPLDVPAEMRGRELTLEEVRRFAGYPRTYKVERITARCVVCGDYRDPAGPAWAGLADRVGGDGHYSGGAGQCGDLHHWLSIVC